MSELAKDRHTFLMMVIDLIAEEIEKGESCPVCTNVLEKLQKVSLVESEIIIESLREVYGIVPRIS